MMSNTMSYFLKHLWQTTRRLLESGVLLLAVSIMRLALVVLLPVGVLISLLLTIRIRNKT
jgi:hypothetical protein